MMTVQQRIFTTHSVKALQFIVIMCLVGKSNLLSQTNSEQDSTIYFINLDDYFNISADFETDYETFLLEGENFKYDIRPNFSYYNKVGIDYRALSFFYTYTPKIAANKDEDLKGKTDLNGFGFSFNTNKLINHVRYLKVKGFYLENSEEFIPDFETNETPYIQFPGLSYTSYRGRHYYKFNPTFSYTAFNVQMARQTISAGSFALGLSWNYYLLNNEDPNGQDSKNLELLVDGSYYYTFVLDSKWYLNLGAITGIGATSTQLTTPMNGQSVVTNYTALKLRLSGILGIGYNAKTIFAGADIRTHHKYHNQPQNGPSERQEGFSFRVFLGFHILAPKIINKSYDSVERFFGM